MYVNEPNEKALLPETEDDVFFEEPRDYHEFFWDDFSLSPGRPLSGERGIQAQVCRFDTFGNHISMAKSCPHFDQSDEMGRAVNPSWTVQQSW